jgi:DNA-binding response OmpR family regulator
MTDAHIAAAGDPMRDGGSAVLLHVEPDPRSAELLAAFADRSADGIAVRSVDGMRAALDAFDETDEIDCVVTEQRLPDGSGVELVDRLRKRGVEVPIAFHTTCCGDDTEARALAVGADAYFPKRSERGQYDRLLERLHGFVGEGGRNAGTATTVSPDAPESSARAPGSEE